MYMYNFNNMRTKGIKGSLKKITITGHIFIIIENIILFGIIFTRFYDFIFIFHISASYLKLLFLRFI